MLIESFSQAILKWLRVPPGASVRHANQKGISKVEDNDYVQAILGITVDDICIGEAPLSIDYETENLGLQKALDQIIAEFNTIVKDVARDLCLTGVSLWEVFYDEGELKLFPIIDEVKIFLDKHKELIVKKEDVKIDCLIFINYTKSSLSATEEPGARFEVSPIPMQLKNAESTIEGITNAEKSIARYRGLLKPVRYANVDIGAAQGDKQQSTIDSISSAINADSESLTNSSTYTDFDDNIPVLPNRKGIGRVDIVTDIPSADIKELADLDYWVSKLNLVMRFPATYMDFSKSMNESAVSALRGDIRYLKLCESVQSKITTTINKFLQSTEFAKVKPVVSLIQVPSSEDDDIINALGDYNDLASSLESFIMEAESKEQQKHRLVILKDLYDSVTSSPLLQKMFDDFEQFIDQQVDTSEGNPDLPPEDDPDLEPEEEDLDQPFVGEPEQSEDVEYLDTFE